MEVKNPITYEQQIEKLKSRNCSIADEEHAKSVLRDINYYRLSAYFLPFKQEDDTYGNVDFSQIYRIHEFDRKLRSLLFSIIEEIELRLRSIIAYHYSHAYGALGYKDADNFDEKHHNHDRMIENIEGAIRKNEKQLFVSHHIKKYDGKFPFWVIVELFTLGELSIFYSDLHTKDKKVIAKEFNVHYANLRSWLMCLTILRNYCAHYSRIYYNTFPATPKPPANLSYLLKAKAFDYIMVLKFLYSSQNKWRDSFIVQLGALISEYESCIKLEHLGFPENWLDLLKA